LGVAGPSDLQGPFHPSRRRTGGRELLMRAMIGALLLALALGCGDNTPKSVVVPLEEVPAPLLKKAQQELPNVKFDHARKLPNGNFEIRGKEKSGKVREVQLTPTGEVVEIE